MLDELAAEWRDDHSVASRDWIGAAVSAASFVAPARLPPLRAWLCGLPRQTLWVQAACASAQGGLFSYEGAPDRAAAAYAEVVGIYERIGNATDRAIAEVATAQCFLAAGSTTAAQPYLRSAIGFVRRNSAHRLLNGLPLP
jgi:hypothetical protein